MVGAKANRSFVGEQDSSNPLATSQASRGTSKLSLFPMYIAPVHNYKHVVFEWTLFEEPRWRIILASWNLPTTKCVDLHRSKTRRKRMNKYEQGHNGIDLVSAHDATLQTLH